MTRKGDSACPDEGNMHDLRSRADCRSLSAVSSMEKGEFARETLVMMLHMAQLSLTAVFMKVPEGYVAFVEELPGANTQGSTLDEARDNLSEAVAMVLEANRELSQETLGRADVIREKFILPAA